MVRMAANSALIESKNLEHRGIKKPGKWGVDETVTNHGWFPSHDGTCYDGSYASLTPFNIRGVRQITKGARITMQYYNIFINILAVAIAKYPRVTRWNCDLTSNGAHSAISECPRTREEKTEPSHASRAFTRIGFARFLFLAKPSHLKNKQFKPAQYWSRASEPV